MAEEPALGTVVVVKPLNIRQSKPSTSAAIVRQQQIGAALTVTAILQGDAVNGNSRWYAGTEGTFFWSGACSEINPLAGPKPSGALGGRVESAKPALHGFDINRPLNNSDLKSFYAQGFRFCLRYLTRAANAPQAGDLTRDEADRILANGFALMAVQHVASEGWHPTATLGRTYGQNAVDNAQSVGLPPGVNLWLDLEGVSDTATAPDVVDYCNAWFKAVEAADYATGIYVGANSRLSGDDLFWRLKTKHYWKSGSKVPDIPVRGYQMLQWIPPGPDTADTIDRNVTQNDAFGDAVQWLTRA